MENRRHDYRHAFPPDFRLRVEISLSRGGAPLIGEMLNLSIGGMTVDLGDATVRLDANEEVCVRFAIPHGLRHFTIPSTIVHIDPAPPGAFGLCFLPLDDPDAQEEREKNLWVFLLDEQRRSIKEMRSAVS
jgi:hypothetical protein